MKYTPNKYSRLFSLFAYDKPDKTGTILQTVGTVGFMVSAIGYALMAIIADNTGESLLFRLALTAFGAGFAVGFLAFLSTAVYYSGRDRGDANIFVSSIHSTKNAVLFLLFPTLILALLIYGWAVLTNQPGIH